MSPTSKCMSGSRISLPDVQMFKICSQQHQWIRATVFHKHGPAKITGRASATTRVHPMTEPELILDDVSGSSDSMQGLALFVPFNGRSFVKEPVIIDPLGNMTVNNCYF